MLIERICCNGRCQTKFLAREVDVTRGWAKCCSKSCAATVREKKTGNYKRFQARKRRAISSSESASWHNHGMNAMEEGWDGHKIWSAR